MTDESALTMYGMFIHIMASFGEAKLSSPICCYFTGLVESGQMAIWALDKEGLQVFIYPFFMPNAQFLTAVNVRKCIATMDVLDIDVRQL
jgi:hypothetical protein